MLIVVYATLALLLSVTIRYPNTIFNDTFRKSPNVNVEQTSLIKTQLFNDAFRYYRRPCSRGEPDVCCYVEAMKLAASGFADRIVSFFLA